jgi:hypothetical protein
MNNLALYENRTFSYVIVDQVLTKAAVTSVLGAPRAVVPCRGYSIYDYRNTRGERLLTAGLEKSLAVVSKTHKF